ncbi:vascular endothelial growth factor A-like [Oppia nitens]|uniref:vascular endothelial growth factor A-like n=1 Tax=Oppia nitens TaxID=1686743 RepID=UPI0023DCC31F|nr:vascular endothelial growth factor A-like [Oppia nitens]
MSHVTHVTDLLDELGFGISGRLTGQTIGQQASCAPELKSIELDDTFGQQNDIFFPKCVRIQRCGGCCGPSRLLKCVPTKKSYKNIRRAHIRYKRSLDGRAVPELNQHTVKVEVHEECRCECLVQQSHCNPFVHKYRPDLCKCQCLHLKDQLECKLYSDYKVWDPIDCRCKCIHTKLCSTGLYFDDQTCGCIEAEYKHQ